MKTVLVPLFLKKQRDFVIFQIKLEKIEVFNIIYYGESWEIFSPRDKYLAFL